MCSPHQPPVTHFPLDDILVFFDVLLTSLFLHDSYRSPESQIIVSRRCDTEVVALTDIRQE
jgi:hypothetical protein